MSEASLRPRVIVSKQTSQSEAPTITAVVNEDDREPPLSESRPLSLSQRAISQTLTSTVNLANLLPTGTLLAFQLLVPIFSNNGSCDSATRPMTLLLALSCFLPSFTDSVKSSDGQVYYGFATFKGMLLFDYLDSKESSLPDLSKYRIKLIDGVHAVLSVFVFGAVALRDKNVLNCFYPTPEHETEEVLNIAPVGVGLICSLLFVVFPTRRHGIGYPITTGK